MADMNGSLTAGRALQRVIDVVDRLLDPDSGCPWDRKQTPTSIGSYILEETYELIDALENGDQENAVEELGDCLFLHCFMARLFRDAGRFDLIDALNVVADKMIHRHPHVFGHGPTLDDAEDVKAQWHEIKRKEKTRSLLMGVPKALPALLRAHRLTERAGRVGFDWDGPQAVLHTLDQELEEFREAMEKNDREAVAAELGDVLFTLSNLGRHLKIGAEEALRAANERFVRRFEYIEQRLDESGKKPEETDLAEMDRLWEDAKANGL
jgi:MazG family protein